MEEIDDIYDDSQVMSKGRYIQNEHAMVSVLIPQERVQSDESAYFVDRTFSGSLPRFIAAFLGERNISDNEAKEIQEMIDRYRKEQ